MQLLQELPLKFAWLLQRPPLFSISPQVLLQMSFGAYGCRNYHGEVFFWAQKLDPIRNGSSMFLLIVIRSKSGSRDENLPAVERVSLVGRFSLIYVGFDEHPKITGHRHAGFLFTINCTRTLSSVGQQQMSSMWHHRISMGIMYHVVTCSCWRCHYHPLPL